MALSLGLPPVAVSDCRILRCPDFPLAFEGKRPSNGLPIPNYTKDKQVFLARRLVYAHLTVSFYLMSIKRLIYHTVR